LEPRALEVVLRKFLGPQAQIPPMYSALKRDGQPLYKLARAGVEVERQAREIELFELVLLGSTADRLELQTVCSKGTYVRVLSEDIAKALGTCGHVTALRRVYVEPFDVEPMETLEALIRGWEEGRSPRILPADWPLSHLPKISLSSAETARLQQGQLVPIDAAVAAVDARVYAAPRIRLYDNTGRFLGIGASDGSGTIQPRRLFVF
jgi:tRNA pseudouridine55 synthase